MFTAEVVMLGPSQVGKTSMLASMYRNFANELLKTDLRIDADVETAGILEDALEGLHRLSDTASVSNTVRGNTEERQFSFQFGAKSDPELSDPDKSDPGLSFEITFYDPPGYHMTKQSKRVCERVHDAAATLIAVDAVALMESEGTFANLHNLRNKPKLIRSMFRDAYNGLEEPRLVMLVPIRCECYVTRKTTAKRLHASIREHYQQVLEVLAERKDEAGRHLTSVVITPIQTVGNVEFERLVHPKDVTKQPTPTEYEYLFKKPDRMAPFAPVDTEQPLRYVMRFVLHNYLKYRAERTWWQIWEDTPAEKFFEELFKQIASGCGDGINKLFGGATELGEFFHGLAGNGPLRNAIVNFTKECKEEPPFEVVQGAEWLTLNGTL